MDSLTSDFYERYAGRLTTASEARRSAMLPHVERIVIAGASVLDVGSGSGRDVAAMLDFGFDAFGVEPNEAMLEKALVLRPALRGRLRPATLPCLGRPFSDWVPSGFDAVVCSAVLMHLESAELLPALASMVDQLRVPTSNENPAPVPVLIISLPRMHSGRLIDDRDEDGRRFHNHDAMRTRDHMAMLGMSFESSIDSDAVVAGMGTVWNTMVFRRRP